ncbi:serine/threonine protein kinase [Cupriavidus basilensis]|uniref:serine/threonine protein kinase n=1 Tax=Cupriavidus basilensis TaxID=68895 RepID=UPI0039F6EDE4
MAYPTLEQYQEALQHPRVAFTDSELAAGFIQSTGLGLPLVISGGFALTYKVKAQNRQFAVRCFHKEAKGLERRYEAISRSLRALKSQYFLDFAYQPQGVRVLGKVHPLIRMEWASGETLGEFLESNYSDAAKIGALQSSLQALAVYLEQHGIAHGDIQSGNLMVSPDGKRVQLIDYDGMYVPEAAQLGASELGHRNFQHPGRTSQQFDAKLDRFSFIQLNLALRALRADPTLWSRTQSEADAVVFRANDYAAPSSSLAFDAVSRLPGLERDARNFSAVCRAGYAEVPTLSDFLAGQSVPQQIVVINVGRVQSRDSTPYIGPYPVLDATSFEAFTRHVGQMVELVGRIVEVTPGLTKHGKKPYIFINFADWRGRTAKLSIWSEALAKMAVKPDASWVGRWVSVKGMVDPVYVNKKLKYEHVGITISTAHQIQSIGEPEAKYRLGTGPNRAVGGAEIDVGGGARVTNGAMFDRMRDAQGTPPPRVTASTTIQSGSANQQLLNQMRAKSTGGSAAAGPSPSHNSPSPAHRTANSNTPSSFGGYGSQSKHQHSGKSAKNSGWAWWVWVIITFVIFVFVARH